MCVKDVLDLQSKCYFLFIVEKNRFQLHHGDQKTQQRRIIKQLIGSITNNGKVETEGRKGREIRGRCRHHQRIQRYHSCQKGKYRMHCVSSRKSISKVLKKGKVYQASKAVNSS